MASILVKAGVPAAVAGLGLVATACGGGGSRGSVEISGSSTVEPITALVAERFANENPRASLRVDGPGTTDGFILFCDEQIDIANASRPIAPGEKETCASNGVEYVELYIGIDAVSVIVPADSPVDCLTFDDLYAMFGPESADFDTWGDAAELATARGGASGIPQDLADTSLTITRPGEESGTYGSFIEIVTEPIAEEQGVGGGDAGTLAVGPNTQQSGNDNVIIDGVSGSRGGLGFVGVAYAEENRDRVNTVEIDDGDGCVAPNDETIASGEYPISRPLFIYPNLERARDDEAVRAFVDFYLSDAGYDAVAEAGYIQVRAADRRQTKQAWREARRSR